MEAERSGDSIREWKGWRTGSSSRRSNGFGGIRDGDLDLANNYRRAREGDFDLGVRFRGVEVDRHVDRDLHGREISFHPPYMSLILAAFAWPFRNTVWVEPVSIWITLLAGWTGAWLLYRLRPETASWAVLYGPATPIWCYSRDLWTEPWVATVWIALLLPLHPVALGSLAMLGTLIKYPFFLVPFVMGLEALRKRRWERGSGLVGGSWAGLLTAVGVAQYVFRDTDHFSLLHMGFHTPAASPVMPYFTLHWEGLSALLLDPENGLLVFTPFLVWGLLRFRKGGEVFLPALALLPPPRLLYGMEGRDRILFPLPDSDGADSGAGGGGRSPPFESLSGASRDQSFLGVRGRTVSRPGLRPQSLGGVSARPRETFPRVTCPGSFDSPVAPEAPAGVLYGTSRRVTERNAVRASDFAAAVVTV